MLSDFVGSVWGALVFSLALLPPGYLAARWMLRPGFTCLGLREQLAWSIALSFGTGTILIAAFVWLTGVVAAGWILILTAALALYAARHHRTRCDIPRKEAIGWALAAFAMVLVILFSLVDLGKGSHLWMSMVDFDFSVRAPLVGAVMRSGVPPANPLYWPGHAAPMHYYYFWYVTCGVIARLAHVTARQALMASCLWPPLGVVAMLGLFARHMLGWRGQRLRTGVQLAAALLAVTGLDLLANLWKHFSSGGYFGDMEWWSIDQITSWADAFLWVPHHIAALICCLLTALLLWSCLQQGQSATRLRFAAIAGLSFASAFGLSTYVAFAAALILALWTAWLLLKSDVRIVVPVLTASLVALVTITPYLIQTLRRSPEQANASGHLFAFAIRRMLDPALLANAPGFRHWFVSHPQLETNAAALVLLLPGYFLELGFFGIALVLQSRRKSVRSEGERTLLFWTWSGLFFMTIIRSQMMVTSDFSYRAALLPQFFLLLIAVMALQQCTRPMRWVLLSLASIGILGTTYQIVMLRIFVPYIESIHYIPGVAEPNYAFRDAYHAADAILPPGARIQYNPSSVPLVLAAQMIQTNRQIVNADPGCSTNFGGELSACRPLQDAVHALYDEPSTDAATATALCRHIQADFLVATRWDAVWNAPGGWADTLPAVVARPDVRIVSCAPPPVR